MRRVFFGASHHVNTRQGLGLVGMALILMALSGCVTSTTSTSTAFGGGPTSAPSTDRESAAQTRLELAAEYMRIGNFSVALEEANTALKLSPDMTSAFMVRGMIYSQQGDYASAEADYARVMRQRGDDPDVLHNYGWILCQQGRYNEGIAYFDKVLTMPGYTTSARTWITKGLCLQAAGQTREAKESLTKAVQYDPGNPIASYNLANMLYKAGQIADAMVYVRRLNNSAYLNAETLWLGIKIENAMSNQLGVRELGEVLSRRFPQSRELVLYERKAFYE